MKTEDETDGNRGARRYGTGPRWALGAALLSGAIAIAGVTAGPASAAAQQGGHSKGGQGAGHSHSHGQEHGNGHGNGHGPGGGHGKGHGKGHGQGKDHGKGHGKGHGHPHGHGKPRGADYVALGDSYAAGPAIPAQIDANCARSDHNYPHDVAAAQHAHLTDATCSGATTAEMTASQGTAPAQFTALGKATDLVTVSIGGNDIGFSTIVGTCAQLGATDPAGDPCHTHYTSGGTDQLKVKIQQTAPKIAQVVRGIHQRAPHAKVLVVGYPDLLPDSGAGCTSAEVPFAAGDFGYLRDTERALNTMLAQQARLGGAGYVDTYKPTVGHDMCRPVGERWIETVVPSTPVAPAHPNAQGEQAMATAVEHATGGRDRAPHGRE